MTERPTAEAIEAARRYLVHEMRNSIGAIRSAAELLQRRYNPEGRDLRLFEIIFQEADALNELVGKKPAPPVDG